jgi:hypothetical protein
MAVKATDAVLLHALRRRRERPVWRDHWRREQTPAQKALLVRTLRTLQKRQAADRTQ